MEVGREFSNLCVLKSMLALLQKSRSILLSVFDWTSKNRDQS